MGEADGLDELRGKLSVGLDIEDLTVEEDRSDRLVVRVELSYTLGRRESDSPSVDLEAAIRLVYEASPLASRAAQRAFMCERALGDAWPVWRAWLNTELAAMGVSPAPLPPDLPPRLRARAPEAFDLSRQIEERVRARRETAK